MKTKTYAHDVVTTAASVVVVVVVFDEPKQQINWKCNNMLRLE